MSCSIFNSEILSLVHELRQSTIISVAQFACTTVETLVRTLTCRYLLVRKRYIRLTAAMCWILLNASCLSKNVHTLSLLHLYYVVYASCLLPASQHAFSSFLAVRDALRPLLSFYQRDRLITNWQWNNSKLKNASDMIVQKWFRVLWIFLVFISIGVWSKHVYNTHAHTHAWFLKVAIML